jgi:hypothetical protein
MGGDKSQRKWYGFITAISKYAELTQISEAHFNRLFQSIEHYEIDYCLTGQLFVRRWLPMTDMPENPPAPRYGPGY